MSIETRLDAASPCSEEAPAPRLDSCACEWTLAGPGRIGPVDVISSLHTTPRTGGPGGRRFAPGSAMIMASANSRCRWKSPKSSSTMSWPSAARGSCSPATGGPTSGGDGGSEPRDRDRDLRPIRGQGAPDFMPARLSQRRGTHSPAENPPIRGSLCFYDIVHDFCVRNSCTFYVIGIPKRGEISPALAYVMLARSCVISVEMCASKHMARSKICL